MPHDPDSGEQVNSSLGISPGPPANSYLHFASRMPQDGLAGTWTPRISKASQRPDNHFQGLLTDGKAVIRNEASLMPVTFCFHYHPYRGVTVTGSKEWALS